MPSVELTLLVVVFGVGGVGVPVLVGLGVWGGVADIVLLLSSSWVLLFFWGCSCSSLSLLFLLGVGVGVGVAAASIVRACQ